MVNKTISIPFEINEQLKNLENASGLITDLLITHFKLDADSIEDIEEKQKEIKSKEQKFLEQLEDDFKLLENKKTIIKKQTEFIEKKQKLTDEKKKEMIKSIKKNFKDLTNTEMTDEQLKKYLDNLKKKDNYNIFMFVEECQTNNTSKEEKKNTESATN
jgi:hypothetical protein